MDTTEMATTPSPLRFHGNASEYFRIWIVNLALTILTLGVYSAWAKVRTLKYFYGNTELMGSRFDYHARPLNILIGRLIIGVLVVGWLVGSRLFWELGLVFLGLLLVLTPWLVVRGMIFNLSNTSYRNLRFGFPRDYKESYLTYLKAVLTTALTFGLGVPYALYLHVNYRLNRIRFGNQTFQFRGKPSAFFYMYLQFIGIILAAAMSMGLAAFLAFYILGKEGAIIILPGTILMYGILFYGGALFRARLINTIANQAKLNEVSFKSSLKGSGLAFIYITNILACLFTLGLAVPWATIRAYKYRIDNTAVLAPLGAFEQIGAGAARSEVDATADAAVDFWDINLDFGF